MSKIMKNHNLQTRKRGVMKDIEDWIHEKHKKDGETDFDDFMNKSSHKDSRMSGQLAENVTEERLLHSRLFEIGNERYKFLARFAFEKQQFQDKKVKRINAMKARVMSAGSAASAPGRLVSSRQSMISERSEQTKTDRLNGLNGQQSTQSGVRDLPSRARTVHFMPSQTRKKPETRVVKTSTPTVGYHPSSKFTFQKKNKFEKFGGAIPGVTHDPRYSFLERALSPAYIEPRNKKSVPEIVNGIESLHRLPGMRISKVDMSSKIQNFMQENQLTIFDVAKVRMVAKRLSNKINQVSPGQ